jgi:hypothetical protein
MTLTEADPRKWDRNQQAALAIAAAIGVAVMLIWQRPIMDNVSLCFTSRYDPLRYCGKMWLSNILPAFCWIVLGALLGTGVIYVTRLTKANTPPQAPRP